MVSRMGLNCLAGSANQLTERANLIRSSYANQTLTMNLAYLRMVSVTVFLQLFTAIGNDFQEAYNVTDILRVS